MARTIIFFIIISQFGLLSSKSDPISVWPKPRIFSWPEPEATFLSSEFNITAPEHTQLSSAVSRYLSLIKSEHYHHLVTPSVNVSSSPPLQTLSIDVDNLSVPLKHGVNESYTLTITSDENTAYLAAPIAWGAMRGLETFSQLVWGDPSCVAVGVYVWDEPLFEHRGLLLDTSRNFYEVDDILKTISAMSHS